MEQQTKKQTAVEWLIDMISYTSKDTYSAMESSKFFEQAKEIENQQMKEKYDNGYANGQRELNNWKL